MAAFSASGAVHAPPRIFRPSLSGPSQQKLPLWLNRNETSLVLLRSQRVTRYSQVPTFFTVNNQKTNVGNTNEGAVEPARVLLERLFVQTQKLEEKMNKGSGLIKDYELSNSLEVLESDIQAALLALRRREEDLQNAERKVLFDHAELTQATSALANQEQMEQDLRTANSDLAFKAREIGDLRLLVEEQRWKIVSSQAALSVKEDELTELRNELIRKNDEIQSIIQEIKSRDQLLKEANKVIEKQEGQLKKIQRELKEREDDLAKSLQLKKVEEGKLRVAESRLEKQGLEWLLTQKALKELAVQASQNINGAKEAREDFRRVSALLSDVKSELISSRKSLASSRKILVAQVHQLEKKKAELQEESLSVTSYSKSLEDAQLEVENERAKLGVVVAQRDKLRMQLLSERTRIDKMEEELRAEKCRLERANREIDSLQKDLQQKTLDFNRAQDLLQAKESELDGARLQIQDLKSEQASVELILKEKDEILWDTQQKLADLSSEIVDLRGLMKSREDLLLQTTGQLQEKEEHALVMKHELDDTKAKFSEAVTIVEQISQLTDKLVVNAGGPQVNPGADFGKQEQLETELKVKEMECRAARRALAVKDEELESVHRQLETKEEEMQKMKELLWQDRSRAELPVEKAGDREEFSKADMNPKIEKGSIDRVERELTNLLSLTHKLLREARISG
ncbi:unnamed protein product [Spirodela intermedia]|uniref:Uncharacterized protein n=1 Tax=Spirodela intermedia TaxID=51605 RepID=A0A7I8JS39_SPIIN|nr:unnamed protein product [Spirodela intermedia]CAA6672565.1 unnamed protein product [Spirodela intermedia]